MTARLSGIFVSYASQDAAAANVVVDVLERAGLACWIAPRDVVPGYGAAKGMAIFHTVCGDIDLAADRYEKAIEERDSFVVAFLQGAIGEPLRASGHWPRLAALINLPGLE